MRGTGINRQARRYFPKTTFHIFPNIFSIYHLFFLLLSKCCDKVSLEELREERETHVQFAVPEMDRT